MKKILLFAVIFIGLCLTSCGKKPTEKTPTPTKEALVAPTNLEAYSNAKGSIVSYEVSWDNVEGASYYEVTINGKTASVKKNTYDISSKIIFGTTTDISVTTCVTEGDNVKKSDATTISYTPYEVNDYIKYTEKEDGTYEATATNQILNGLKGTVVFADKYRGVPVTSVSSHALIHYVVTEKLDGIFVSTSVDKTNNAVTKKVVLGKNITELNKYCFAYCDALEEIVIPSSIETIPMFSFAYCPSLKKVTLNEGLLLIEQSAFYKCSSLEEITFPKSLQEIERSAFQDTNLSSVTFKGTPIYYYNTFINTPYDDTLEGFVTSGTNLVVYKGTKSTIKATDFPEGITTICQNAFQNNTSLVSVELPKSVTTIGMYAFVGCKSLNTLTLNEGLKKIEQGSFSGCGLTAITLPSSLENIGTNAFSGCKIAEVTIPENCSLERLAFNNSALKKVVFSGGVELKATKYETYDANFNLVVSYYGMFESYQALEEVVLSSTMTKIDQLTFKNCSALKKINLENITEFGENAFYGCSSLDNIILNENLKEIPDCCFFMCSSLKSIVIPNNVTVLGVGAFNGCSSLESVTLSENITEIQTGTFYRCSSLKSIVIPAKVTSIGGTAFYQCSSLTEIYMSNNITTVGRFGLATGTTLTIHYDGTKAEWDKISFEGPFQTDQKVTIITSNLTFEYVDTTANKSA